MKPKTTKQLMYFTDPDGAYPENADSNTCAPNTLKFHTFCGLCVTKQCFKFEVHILNGSGVIAT